MLHFRENEICICVCSWKSTINPYNVNWQRINWRNVSFWTHLEFDKCDLEKSVLDIFDIDSFASFVCSICDSVYSLYTCKHCSKVVQWLFKGACVCVWVVALHAPLCTHTYAKGCINHCHFTSRNFLPIFLSFQIILHFIFLRSCICMCLYVVYGIVVMWFLIVNIYYLWHSATTHSHKLFTFHSIIIHLGQSSYVLSRTYVLLAALFK